jgi:hypothetical protein
LIPPDKTISRLVLNLSALLPLSRLAEVWLYCTINLSAGQLGLWTNQATR